MKTFISEYDICRSVDPKHQRETLHSHDMAYRPWAKVGIDLLLNATPTFDTKSNTVIRKLKAHFARQGIPDMPHMSISNSVIVETLDTPRAMGKLNISSKNNEAMLVHHNTL